jgi:predicted RNA binding protein YcfA (HicA-like mRNA interferase family)
MTPQEKAKEVMKYLISKGAKLVNKKGSILIPIKKDKNYGK